MLRAFLLAAGQLFDRRILTLLGAAALLGVACFAAVWIAVWQVLTRTALFETGWLETIGDVFGGLLTVVLTWFLFPLLATTFVGLFLEPVARAVEARHYPHLPPAPGPGLLPGILASLRFLGTAMLLNAALLPFLLLPPVYPVVYVLVNGVLVGREYFELVALRRLDPAAARSLRRRRASEVLLLGCAIAFLATLPIVNFVAPVLATMATVHRFESWRRAERPTQPAAGG